MPTDSVPVSPELQFARDEYRNIFDTEVYESPVAEGEQLPADNTPRLPREMTQATPANLETNIVEISGDVAEVLAFEQEIARRIIANRSNNIHPNSTNNVESDNVVQFKRAPHVYVQGELKRAA